LVRAAYINELAFGIPVSNVILEEFEAITYGGYDKMNAGTSLCYSAGERARTLEIVY